MSEEPIPVTAVFGRTGVGVSRPFICLADGKTCFVKRENVGWNQLVKEWVGSSLAKQLDLPIAEFGLVQIPSDFASSRPDFGELTQGVGFASYAPVQTTQEFRKVDAPKISFELRQKILVFDRWIHNEDRKAGVAGGNSNLLWQDHSQSCLLIDHDNALDADFDDAKFYEEHIFGDCRPTEPFSKWLESAIDSLPAIWDTLPESWLFDRFGDQRASLTLSQIEATLECYK